MKELKGKSHDGVVRVVSVAPTLDVVAVVVGRDVTIYRMPLSKVAHATLAAEATCACWGPAGRILGVGTAEGLVLLNVEDCSVVATHMQGQRVIGAQWVLGLDPPKDAPAAASNGTASGSDPSAALDAACDPLGVATTHPLAFLNNTMLPMMFPPNMAPQSQPYEVARMKFQALDAAFTAVGDKKCHFLAVLTQQAVHIIAYGVTRVLSIPLGAQQQQQAPHHVTSLSAFHLLKSVVLRAEGSPTLQALGVEPANPLATLSELAVHQDLLRETLAVVRKTADRARQLAVECEKDVFALVDSHADMLRLFVKGPTLREDIEWVTNRCEPRVLGKLVKLTQKNMTEVGRVMLDAVTSGLDYAKALLLRILDVRRALRVGGGSDGVAQMMQALDNLQGMARKVVQTAVTSQTCTTHLLGWFSELPQVCERGHGGGNNTAAHHHQNGLGGAGGLGGGDEEVDLSYDPRMVLSTLELHTEGGGAGARRASRQEALLDATHPQAIWCTLVGRGIEELCYAVVALEQIVEADADHLHSLSSQHSAATTTPIHPPLPSDHLLAAAETPKNCRRYHATALPSGDAVAVTIVTDHGPKKGANRWRTRSYTLPIARCRAASFYVRADDDVLLWTASVSDAGGGALTLTLTPVVCDGVVEEEGGVITSAACATCELTEQAGLSNEGGVQLACGPRGLAAACVTSTEEGKSYVAVYDLEDDDDDGDEDDEEEGDA